nr:hypothetical protein BaRGS_002577 [Batillaria attramentaria]
MDGMCDIVLHETNRLALRIVKDELCRNYSRSVCIRAQDLVTEAPVFRHDTDSDATDHFDDDPDEGGACGGASRGRHDGTNAYKLTEQQGEHQLAQANLSQVASIRRRYEAAAETSQVENAEKKNLQRPELKAEPLMSENTQKSGPGFSGPRPDKEPVHTKGQAKANGIGTGPMEKAKSERADHDGLPSKRMDNEKIPSATEKHRKTPAKDFRDAQPKKKAKLLSGLLAPRRSQKLEASKVLDERRARESDQHTSPSQAAEGTRDGENSQTAPQGKRTKKKHKFLTNLLSPERAESADSKIPKKKKHLPFGRRSKADQQPGDEKDGIAATIQ